MVGLKVKIAATLATLAVLASAMPASAGTEGQYYYTLTVTRCWTVPLTGGMQICRTEQVVVSQQVMDGLLDGSISPNEI
jgi:hypothetical protein